ncbi:Trans-2,3-dihydro-3-hydroxyanthranilate isomerase [Microbacterium azadirachtae]|uniref:Trans-2,3-dihydro-3-hydroxyanthranilate isomerase n=2 Tax=Microbacterium azadirachtae TaxID=582680 RepID=A0A0F0KYF0_9MICO|nr:Trans-2,3-dihydro-3-hydroxyanthranilate isomerase [Microbacterium azadirachtae]
MTASDGGSANGPHGGYRRSMRRPFRQVDVFSETAYRGNPVAVVLDAEGIEDEDLRRFSVWTNLSECTFVLPPTTPDADYRVRIFSLEAELAFAGHPTLGTARAWLDAGGTPTKTDRIVQECRAGLVPIRIASDGLLSFSAPARTRAGAVAPDYLAKVAAVLGIDRNDVVDAEWLDNGAGWVGILLGDDEAVLNLTPSAAAYPGQWDIGVIGPVRRATGPDRPVFELRAFFSDGERTLREDPVTGSLNAAAAEWMLATGRAATPYIARQGTTMGREGRVHISEDDGRIWVGGRTSVAISGNVEL